MSDASRVLQWLAALRKEAASDNKSTPLPENIKVWIAALRSGKYKQGRGKLREDDRFCCLGVACDISGMGEWSDKGVYRIRDQYAGRHCSMTEKIGVEVLPIIISRWLGLKNNCGGFWRVLHFEDHKDRVSQLTTLNDQLRWNFNQIADFIEQNWDILGRPNRDRE